MTRTSDVSVRASLMRLLEPIAKAEQVDLDDVVVTPAGRRRLLRVIVDRDGGLSLDTVAAVSTAVSAALDDSDVMGGMPYVLEVSSPGIERPLTQPRHWRRNLTRLVTVTTAEGTSLSGRLVTVDDDGIDIEDVKDAKDKLASSGAAITRLSWARAVSGRVQIEFNRPSTNEPDGDDPDASDPAETEED